MTPKVGEGAEEAVGRVVEPGSDHAERPRDDRGRERSLGRRQHHHVADLRLSQGRQRTQREPPRVHPAREVPPGAHAASPGSAAKPTQPTTETRE